MTGAREFDRALEQELSAWPDVAWRWEIGGKHRRLILETNGQTQFQIVPLSSRSRCGIANCVAQTRRILRAMGAKKQGR